MLFHAPHSPNQSSLSENGVRNVKGTMRALLKGADKPPRMWDLTIDTVMLCHNIILKQLSRDPTRTPFQLFHGFEPDLKYAKVWGCAGFRFVPKGERRSQTFSDRAQPGHFIGLDPDDPRTFFFLNLKWQVIRGTTGAFYEHLTHVKDLPDHRHIEDGLTFGDGRMDLEYDPIEPIDPPRMRQIDPRAHNVNVQPVQHNVLEPEEKGTRIPTIVPNNDVVENEVQISQNDIQFDPNDQPEEQLDPNEGEAELFEQLENPANSEPEVGGERRSQRTNHGVPSQRFDKQDFKEEGDLQRAIANSKDPQKQVHEIDRVVQRKTDEDGSKWLLVEWQNNPGNHQWIKEAQLVQNTVNAIDREESMSAHLYEVFEDCLLSVGEQDGQTTNLNVGYRKMMKRSDWKEWEAAHGTEIEGFKQRKTLTVVSKQPHFAIRDTRWTYAVKGDDRKRARLVCRGDQQQFGVDYFVTFSGTPNATTIRFILALCVILNFRVALEDVSQAFLNGKPDTIAYCKIPEGWYDDKFKGDGKDWLQARTKWCMLVTGNMYGMCQAGKIWQDLAIGKMTKELGFQRSQIDGGLFFKKVPNVGNIVDIDKEIADMKDPEEFERLALREGELNQVATLYVDDKLNGVSENRKSLLQAAKAAKHMDDAWGLKIEGDGIHIDREGNEVKRPAHSKDFDGFYNPEEKQVYYKFVFVGITIVVDRRGGRNRISMSQEEYLRKVVARIGGEYGIKDSKPVKRPFPSGFKAKAHLDSQDLPKHQVTFYRSVVAAFNHAAVQTRLDLKLPVSVLSKHFNRPKIEHFEAMLYLIRYVKHTFEHRIEFSVENDVNDRQVQVHCDASCADCLDTRASRSGHVIKFAKGPLMWQSKLQKGVKPANSTAKAELNAATACVKDVNCVSSMLMEMGQRFRMPTAMVDEDDQAVIKMVQNRWTSKRSKSYDVKYFWLRALVQAGKIEFQHVGTADQHADPFTKILHTDTALKHFHALGMRFKRLDI